MATTEPYAQMPSASVAPEETPELGALRQQVRALEQQVESMRHENSIVRQMSNDEVLSSVLTPSGFTLPNFGTVNADPGAATAGAAYDATAQAMIQAAYDLVRQMRTVLTLGNLAT